MVLDEKDNKRTIQLQSNVTDLTAVASINQELKEKINEFQSIYSMPDGVLTGRLVKANNSREPTPSQAKLSLFHWYDL